MNGYEFSKQVYNSRLLHKDVIQAYVACSSTPNDECDWLEFKAGFSPRENDDSQDKSFVLWRISEAILAMANLRGGVVIVGVRDNDHHVVPLSSCDPDNYLGAGNDNYDNYIRMWMQKVLPCTLKWKVHPKKQNQNRVDEYSAGTMPQFDLRICDYLGETVLLIFVEPFSEPQPIQKTEKEKRDAEPQTIYFQRRRGAVGEVVKVFDPETASNNQKSAMEDGDLLEKWTHFDCFFPPFFSVPKANERFVGRKRELAEIESFLHRQKIPILHAAGGAGKSTLAYQYAEKQRAKYTGGLFHISMDGIHSWDEAMVQMDKSSDTAQTLSSWLGLKGTSSTEICQKLLGKAHTSPILLVLDNVDYTTLLEDDNLRAFFGKVTNGDKPDGLDIIATARHLANPLEPDSMAIQYDLCDMEEEDLKTLFRSHCNRGEISDEEIKDLVSILDKSPWAVEIAAKTLQKTRGSTCDNLAKKFRDSLEALDGQPTCCNRNNVKMLLEPSIGALRQEPNIGTQAYDLALIVGALGANIPRNILFHLCRLIQFDGGDPELALPQFEPLVDLLVDYSFLKKAGFNYVVHRNVLEGLRMEPDYKGMREKVRKVLPFKLMCRLGVQGFLDNAEVLKSSTSAFKNVFGNVQWYAGSVAVPTGDLLENLWPDRTMNRPCVRYQGRWRPIGSEKPWPELTLDEWSWAYLHLIREDYPSWENCEELFLDQYPPSKVGANVFSWLDIGAWMGHLSSDFLDQRFNAGEDDGVWKIPCGGTKWDWQWLLSWGVDNRYVSSGEIAKHVSVADWSDEDLQYLSKDVYRGMCGWSNNPRVNEWLMRLSRCSFSTSRLEDLSKDEIVEILQEMAAINDHPISTAKLNLGIQATNSLPAGRGWAWVLANNPSMEDFCSQWKQFDVCAWWYLLKFQPRFSTKLLECPQCMKLFVEQPNLMRHLRGDFGFSFGLRDDICCPPSPDLGREGFGGLRTFTMNEICRQCNVSIDLPKDDLMFRELPRLLEWCRSAGFWHNPDGDGIRPILDFPLSEGLNASSVQG